VIVCAVIVRGFDGQDLQQIVNIRGRQDRKRRCLYDYLLYLYRLEPRYYYLGSYYLLRVYWFLLGTYVVVLGRKSVGSLRRSSFIPEYSHVFLAENKNYLLKQPRSEGAQRHL